MSRKDVNQPHNNAEADGNQDTLKYTLPDSIQFIGPVVLGCVGCHGCSKGVHGLCGYGINLLSGCIGSYGDSTEAVQGKLQDQ